MRYQNMNWFVYVVEAQNGMIKIGVSRSPNSRASACNLHSPIPTRLIAAWPAPYRTERDIHNQYAKYRAHNEWFNCDGDMAIFVAAVRGRGIDRVLDWSEIDGSTRAQRKASAIRKQSVKLKIVWSAPGYKEVRLARLKSLRSARKRRAVRSVPDRLATQ